MIYDLDYLESKPSTAFPELFSYDALLVTFSESISGAWMYLTGSKDFEQKVLERAREQNIIIPELVVTISDQPDCGCTLTVLGEPVCQIGNADEIGYFTSDRFLEDLVTRIIQEAVLRFAGADWDSALEELEKCNTRNAYRKLIWFYKYAVPDRKKAFHYAKKLAMFGIRCDVLDFSEFYEEGFGTEQDDLAYFKVLKPVLQERGSLVFESKWESTMGREWIEF